MRENEKVEKERTNNPNISVIIPTYNGAKTIGKVLDSIFSQKYDGDIEIIVVNDHSIDNTLEVVKQYNVIVVNNEVNMGLAKSVNKGVMKAKYDIVCTIHEDVLLVDTTWFKKLVPYLMEDDVAITTSPVILPPNIYDSLGFWEKALFSWEVSDTQDNSVITLNYSDGKNDIFKKNIFLRFGGFDGDTFRVACEDVDLSKRLQKAGYKILSLPVPVYHLHSSHATGLSTIIFKKNPQLSEGQGVLFRKHRSIGGWNNQIIKTIATLLVFIPSLIVRLVGTIYIITIIFGNAFSAFKRLKEPKVLLLILPVKLVDYFLNVYYFWKGFITGRQRK